jgi:hypothetical protein
MRPSGPRGNPAAALLGGLACGALWFLFATTILDVVRPGATVVPALAVAAVMGLAAAAFCWRPGTSREVWGRVALTVGLHALAMPVAAAISFGATGIWPPPETADLGLSVDVFGVRLVGTPTTVRLGVCGFFGGLVLVAIGDRALGRRGLPDRVRRPGRLSR